MKISILSLFPEMFQGFLNTSIIKRAIDKNIFSIEIIDFREYSKDKHKRVDDYPYGGGQGMILMCQPIIDCIKDIKKENSVVAMLTPQGKTFNHEKAKELSEIEHLILVCGHYEGFDERIREFVDIEISIGDYVLTGGEIASMAITDAVVRLIPGTIKEESHSDDSFANGLLEYPQYTRPAIYEGLEVPEVLLSGHHLNIEKWRLKKSIEKTKIRRKDLMRSKELTDKEKKLLKEKI